MLTKEQRQAVLDDYLAQTRANIVNPRAFLDWLRPQADNPAHGYFFAKSDSDAAQEYRVWQFRQFANGLRVSVRVEYTEPKESKVRVAVREYPAFVSPTGTRTAGGGYVPVSVKDDAQMADLRRQGAMALAAWLRRYRGAYDMAGIDVSALDEIVAKVNGGVVVAA